MGIGNRVVAALLRSPAHRVLSGSVVLVRYTGRRSGRLVTTPTQYAPAPGTDGDATAGLVVLVGRPDGKRWWRNFTGGWPLEVLVRGTWVPMSGTALRGHDDPGAVAPLLDAYLERFPKVARTLPADPAERLDGAVVVRCRPR